MFFNFKYLNNCSKNIIVIKISSQKIFLFAKKLIPLNYNIITEEHNIYKPMCLGLFVNILLTYVYIIFINRFSRI